MLVAMLSFSAIIAQNDSTKVLRNKKGIEILPSAGNIGIGIGSYSFFSYIGNLFSDDWNGAPTFGSSETPMVINGCYYLTNSKRLDVELLVGYTRTVTKSGSVIDEEEDVYTNSALTVGVSAGLTKTLGVYNRIRGNYGAFVSFVKTPYSECNSEYPFDCVEGNIKFEDGSNSDNDFEDKGGSTYAGGIGAKLGVEYFFAPKLSLSGDFYLTFMGGVSTDRKHIPAEGDEEVLQAGGSIIDLSTRGSGEISLNFYF